MISKVIVLLFSNRLQNFVSLFTNKYIIIFGISVSLIYFVPLKPPLTKYSGGDGIPEYAYNWRLLCKKLKEITWDDLENLFEGISQRLGNIKNGLNDGFDGLARLIFLSLITDAESIKKFERTPLTFSELLRRVKCKVVNFRYSLFRIRRSQLLRLKALLIKIRKFLFFGRG